MTSSGSVEPQSAAAAAGKGGGREREEGERRVMLSPTLSISSSHIISDLESGVSYHISDDGAGIDQREKFLSDSDNSDKDSK